MYAVVMLKLFSVMEDCAVWCGRYGLGHERLCVQGRYRVDYVLYETAQVSIAVFMVDMSTGSVSRGTWGMGMVGVLAMGCWYRGIHGEASAGQVGQYGIPGYRQAMGMGYRLTGRVLDRA